MTSNQILAMVLMIMYATIHKSTPPMDFNNANFIVPFICTNIIFFIVCFKLVKQLLTKQFIIIQTATQVAVIFPLSNQEFK